MPVPSVVIASIMVGFAEMLQQTPRVTVLPPLAVTLPPPEAVVAVIFVMPAVVTSACPPMKVRSDPIAVPSLLEAARL